MFTVLELLNELEELEEEKPEGDDGLDARLVNALRQSATGQKVLLKIANDCLLSGKHPSEYKNSLIAPIEKKDLGAYRPIALLAVADKIIQGLFVSRVSSCTFSRVSNGQFGFAPGRNPELALAHLHERAIEAKNKKCASAILCLGFKGALDRVVAQ